MRQADRFLQQINTLFTCGYIVGMIPSKRYFCLKCNMDQPPLIVKTTSCCRSSHLGFGCRRCKSFGESLPSGKYK
jgi:hypothetical protein